MPDRIHEASLAIDQWRGTIGEIALLLETAQTILAATIDHSDPIRSQVDVRYEDGSETLASVDRFADARSRIEVDKVETIQSFMRSDDDHHIHFLLGGFPGLRLSASSADLVCGPSAPSTC